MLERNAQLIGGIYHTNQIIARHSMLTICTAHNCNTHDLVELFIVDIPPTCQPDTLQPYLNTLDKRQHNVQSPHVKRLHGWGIDGTRIYVATDPPRGMTLQYVLDTENIEIPRALNLTRQLVMGIKALHEQGIVALDLRPQFITIDTNGSVDRVQIDDIMLRPLLSTLGYVSRPRNDDIGYLDPRYAPPELFNGGYLGVSSDIYQVGLLLFTMATGRLPFVGRNPAETGAMQSTNEIPRMIQYKHDTPTALQDIVDCALAKAPSQRFASATALFNALEALHISSHPSIVEQAAITHRLPSSNLTSEMPFITDDKTLHHTSIEPDLVASQASNQSTLNTPIGADAYAYLCFERAEQVIQRFAMTQKSIIIGRIDPKRGYTPDIDLSTLDTKMTVSRQHARIQLEGNSFTIEDLKSRNKTRLGGLTLTSLKQERLQPGDILHFGGVRLRFESANIRQPSTTLGESKW